MLYTVILSIKSQYFTPKQQIAANDKINGKNRKKTTARYNKNKVNINSVEENGKEENNEKKKKLMK